MVKVNGSIPPTTPQGIIDFFEDNFKRKAKSLQTTEKIIDLKREWVKAVIHNDQIEDALWEYINAFTLS